MESSQTKQITRWSTFYKTYSTQITIGLALVVVCVIWIIATPYFFTWANMLNIGVAISVSGTMAAGLTVVMISGELDLSQYAVMAFCGIFSAQMMRFGLSPVLAIPLSLLLGLGAGALNALLVVKMKVTAFIATIASQLIFRACAFIVNNGAYVAVTNPLYEVIGFNRVLGIPILIIIMLVVFIIVGYVLKNTTYGRKIYAVGGNAVASELSGINVRWIKTSGFIISGLAAGLSSVLLNAQVGSAMPTAGVGNEMDGMAAVFLGGVALSGGKGRIGGTMLGVLLLAVLSNGMTLLSIRPYYQQIIKGLVLLISVYFDILRNNKAKAIKVKAK